MKALKVFLVVLVGGAVVVLTGGYILPIGIGTAAAAALVANV